MAEAISDPPSIRSEVFQDSISQPIRDLLSCHVPNSDQSEALKCQKPNSDQWEAEFGLKRADKAVELEWAWRKSYPDNLSSSIQIDGKNVVFHPNYSSGQFCQNFHGIMTSLSFLDAIASLEFGYESQSVSKSPCTHSVSGPSLTQQS